MGPEAREMVMQRTDSRKVSVTALGSYCRRMLGRHRTDPSPEEAADRTLIRLR